MCEWEYRGAKVSASCEKGGKILEQYVVSQINFSTLAILFCLMGVVEGFRKLGYVDRIAVYFTRFSARIRLMEGVMILSCFVFAMFLTNDVALIVMVPFTIRLLEQMDREDLLIRIIVLETVAANIGGMGTPIGNPQNLYLYQYYDMQLTDFFRTVLPYTVTAAALLLLLVFGEKGRKTDGNTECMSEVKKKNKHNETDKDNDRESKHIYIVKNIKTVLYLFLFILCILTVLDRISYAITFFTVMVAMLLVDRGLLKNINYGLLLKFVGLFLLVGNIAAIPFIREQLQELVVGREFLTGILLSQFISNVPAAVMLSRFTANGKLLLVAVDVGGLGTLIASMASMISFDFYLKRKGSQKRKYLFMFTGYNLLFLMVMIVVYLFYGS